MQNPEYVLFHLINRLNAPVNIQSMWGRLQNHPDYPSLLALSDILDEFGINNVAAKFTINELKTLSTPFIVHLYSNNGEFALINYIDDDNVSISNEWWNNKVIPVKNFKDAYSGTALIVKAGDNLKAGSSKKTDNTSEASDEMPAPTAGETKALPWKITYLDIGASYGLSANWEPYFGDKLFELIMVEPDNVEMEQIQRKYPGAQFIPYALGNKKGEVTINVTSSQSCSSVLEPDFAILNRFPVKKHFEVINKIRAHIYRLDDLIAEKNINKPNFVKIDVQGFEFEVLEGFGQILDNVLCIELEAHLIPIYKNEKTLTDINTYLSNHGFYLRHLESTGTFEGEVVEFNAYFVKREEKLTTKTERAMIQFWESVNQIPEAKRCLR